MTPVRSLVCLVALLAACGDPAPAPPEYEHDPALVPLAGPCSADVRLGGFKVESNEDVGYTALDGVVRDGIVPGLVPEVVSTVDGCALLLRRRLVCDPPCSSDQTCGFDETCVPMPLGQDVGRLRAFGLASGVSIEALQPGNNYSYTRLAHPGTTPDEVVFLIAPGGFLGELRLHGIGVTPLAPLDEAWVVTEGQPLAVAWGAPPAGARSRVVVEISIDQHGLTPATLTCDLPDTGEAEIPQEIVDGLVTAGVTGYPTGRVTRRTVDSTSRPAGCVDLSVTSVRQVGVQVAGHQPCSRPEDCLPPLTCNLAIEQCEP